MEKLQREYFFAANIFNAYDSDFAGGGGHGGTAGGAGGAGDEGLGGGEDCVGNGEGDGEIVFCAGVAFYEPVGEGVFSDCEGGLGGGGRWGEVKGFLEGGWGLEHATYM